MNAILFQCYNSKILNGALIDAFEYFISILENGGKIKLVFIDATSEHIQFFINIFEDRYYLDDLDYKSNIVTMSKRSDIIKQNFNTVLVVDWGTIYHTKGFVRAKNIIVLSDGNTYDNNCVYSKDLYNVTYYGEMPFVYKDHQYNMKMLFHRFKKINDAQDNIFINSPGADNFDFIKKLELPKKKMIFKSIHNHINNTFTSFTTYVYYHGGKIFDLRSRLFHECYFYNKDIIYINDYKIKDGSYYRYQDVKDNGIINRIFSKDDAVIRMFL